MGKIIIDSSFLEICEKENIGGDIFKYPYLPIPTPTSPDGYKICWVGGTPKGGRGEHQTHTHKH
jgi:hypothetical protein